ncbi:hypothetical protein IEQ34_019222 [Dendrobium chrysotoxum]|uniref:Uncharacterized protein n=1 Tax=Dendrobium chrysotoxum TaxID=161865 RepID=A0AAV7G9C2_DENCH|nr:hypothetical protein IEQ34_019222 [Dendrobium chrysotoxum]
MVAGPCRPRPAAVSEAVVAVMFHTRIKIATRKTVPEIFANGEVAGGGGGGGWPTIVQWPGRM